MGSCSSVFHCPFAESSGIYLWTIRQRSDNSHLIHYVGETGLLGKRHREHLIYILGLNYGIFDPEKAQDGIRELIWPGLWRDRTADGPARQIHAYQTLRDHVIRYLSAITIFFAETENDKWLRRQVEGCIGWNLRDKHPEWTVLYPDDNRVARMSEANHGELLITSSEDIHGLDPRIPY